MAQHRRREMAHPMLIRAFLNPSRDKIMLFAPFGYNPLLHPFCFTKSLPRTLAKKHHKLKVS